MNSTAKQSDQNEKEDEDDETSIVDLFDQLCFSFGDEDAIQVIAQDETTTSLGYFELQEYSKALAYQLHWRYRPTYVLVDCQGWPGAEAVALLACMRLQIPLVPVSCRNQHAGKGRLGRIVQQLLKSFEEGVSGSVVALTCCQDDQDPVLGVFQNANVHSILFLDESGNMREPLEVPSHLPTFGRRKDDLYVLFTSGTSGQNPKAVVGSHRSTLKRIQWFQQTLEALPSVAKRTPLTFVDSMAELLGTLLTRESVLVAYDPTRQVMDIGELVHKSQCNQISMLPSQLAQLLQYRTLQPIPSLQRIIISGEPCREELWQSFQKAYFQPQSGTYACQLINLYGQTETTGDCCGAVLTDLTEDQVVVNHTVTIGRPLRPTISMHAADDDNSTTANVEVAVSGNDCLSNGYLLGDDDLLGGFVLQEGGEETEKNHKRHNKCCSFRTGDLGFCTGRLWYVKGRKDDIVKVNGEWTSPSEVETAFLGYRQKCQGVAAVILEGKVYLLVEGLEEVSFSRDQMKEQTKLPWNLIPRQLFPCQRLPRTPGTGKIDRSRAREMVEQCLEKEAAHRQREGERDDKDPSDNDSTDRLYDLFHEIVDSVLHPENNSDPPTKAVDVDMSKSLPELGGDSALAVSLHYQLRLQWAPDFALGDSSEAPTAEHNTDLLSSISPADIMNSETLMDVYSTLMQSAKSKEEEQQRKKPRVQQLNRPAKFLEAKVEPEPISVWGPHHSAVSFAACVDITPLKAAHAYGIVAACQNGLVQLVQCHDDDSDRLQTRWAFHFNGWRVSTDILYIPGCKNDELLFCLTRHPKQDSSQVAGAKVVSMSVYPCSVYWTKELSPNCSVRCPPILCDDCLWIVVSTRKPGSENEGQEVYESDDAVEHSIRILSRYGGEDCADDIQLPVSVVAKPILLTRCEVKRADGTVASKIIVYGSCHWESGLLLVDVEKKCLLSMATDAEDTHRFFSDKIGPIYKDLVGGNGCLLAVDFWGSLHQVNLKSMVCTSLKVSSGPLSSPVLVPTGLSAFVIVGGYDGKVRCINPEVTSILWTCDVQAVIYTRPAVLEDKESVVVCTTAGDVVVINRVTGKEEWRYRLPVGAEIWSDPLELPTGTGKNGKRGSTSVVFGARDSRLHFLMLNSK